MGFLTKLGDIGKSILNQVPVVGGISKAAFGEVGERGFVGRIGGGGGLTSEAGGFQAPMPGMGLPSLPRFPGMMPNGSSNGNGGGGPYLNGNGNGQYSDEISTLLGGDRIVMEPRQKVINTAPPGWVVVDMPDGSGKKAVRKEVARCLGLWKARSKPPISASDWKKLKTANRVKNKAKKIAQTADFKCTKK